MRTLARFSCSDPKRLHRLGSDFNAIIPGFFKGMDPRTIERFSGEVADSPKWSEHVAKLESFLDKHKDLILRAEADGVTVEVDVSLHNEDYEHKRFHRFWHNLPVSLLQRLVDIEAPFTFVIYNVGID